MRILHKLKYKWLAASLFFIGVFLRAYKISELSTFGHDVTRDLILNYKMFLYGEWIYRGPVFSVIWGYLSPVYYYLLFPFHYLSNFHPLSSSVASMFAHLVAILLIIVLIRQHFGKLASLFAVILLVFSVGFIRQSLVGLNPSLVPPFAILAIYSILNIVRENKVHLNLCLFSLAFSFMIALHPSGVFWILPLIAIYLLYKPVFKVNNLLLPGAIFSLLGIMPYVYQEKKLAWWTIKQTIGYIKGSAEVDEQSLTMINYFINFILGVSKSISLTLFDNASVFGVSVGIFILFILFVQTILFFRKKSDYKLLATIIFLYLVNFGLLVKFDEPNPEKKWMAAIFIPLLLIWIGVSLAKIYRTKIWIVSVVSISLIITFNLYNYFTLQITPDSYFAQREVAEAIREDSNGKDFDIYGINPEETYYVLWRFEKDSELKEKYFTWIKWIKEKDSNLIYFIESSYDLDSEKLKSISDDHDIEEIESKIVFTSSIGKKIYRIE